MDIKKYIGEATEYDKKVALEEKKPKSWLKSVSAFANEIGGVLLFGVSNDDELVGLADVKRDSEIISEQIKQRLDPVPQTILELYSEEGKGFIVLKVVAGQETPYYYVADGTRVAFVRIGNESVPADANRLRQLVLRGSGKPYDSLPSGYTISELSFTKLRSVYKIRTGADLADSDFISFERRRAARGRLPDAAISPVLRSLEWLGQGIRCNGSQ